MIPAILSAVFVVYLYKTLNAENTPDTPSGKSGSTAESEQAIASRISDLQARVEQVASEVAKKGGTK